MAADKRTSASTSVETALESLQPIRDLAKNWDIDIAACLEEYLQDLLGDLTEEERQNLPKQAETLNFSQAALVLQNSSSVYSRKVEYLYNLVIQVHEDLIASSGKKKAPGSGNTKRSLDAQIEEFNAFEQNNVDFLLLDDVLPTDEKGNKINLPEPKDTGGERDSGMSFVTNTRLSLGATLMGGASRLDSSGAAAGSQATHRLVTGSLDAGSLRLIDGRCDVGEDGILILPGAGGTSEGKIRRSSNFGSISPRTGPEEGEEDQSAQGPMNFHNEGDFDDHDNDGCGYDFAGDDNNGDPTDTNDDNPDSQANHQSTPQRVASARSAKSAKKKKQQDPWAMLDPHSQEASSAKMRPLRSAKTYKLPPSIAQPPSDCVTGARTRRNRSITTNHPLHQRESRHAADSLALATFKRTLSAQRKSSKSGPSKDSDIMFDMPELPLKGLAYGDEFLYIARAIAKQKAALRREMKKKAKTMNEEAEAEHHQQEQQDFYDADDDGYGAPDFGGGDDFSFGGDDFGGDGEHGNDNMGSTRFGGMEDDDIFSSYNADGDENSEGKTFEELCRAHIQAFAKGAAAYATETRLSKRVGDWHERLAPVLEEEENRPEFDIHAYTKRVVNAIQENSEEDTEDRNPIVGFEVVTNDCPRYEVCRLFLASLSLCNAGNVQLHAPKGIHSRVRLELLDDVIERPMETFLAPSVGDV